MPRLFSPPLLVFYLFALSVVVVHRRGRVRFRLGRQLTDYSTFTAPYNVFVYLCSAVPNRPMLDAAAFPRLQTLRTSWKTLRDEACALHAAGHVGMSVRHDDVYGNALFKRGWRRFYLKWYGDVLPSARRLCPATVALLERLPEVHAAMFAWVAPRSRLGRHRDPLAASLRYHLGLATPNSDHCRILVDGEAYAWRDGEDVLFDETFVHWVENDTDEGRLILFCDVERPMRGRLATGINRLVIRWLGPVTAARNTDDEPLGALNRVVERLYPLHLAARRFKRNHRRAYYAVKYGAVLGVLLLAMLGAFLV